MSILRILLACEESQTVCKAFRQLGHEAYSCDTLPCSGGHPEWHYQCDVLPLLSESWDIIIAFPPCTHLAVSGARFFSTKVADGRQEAAIRFFSSFLSLKCPHVAIENPLGVMSGGFYLKANFPELCEEYNLPRHYDQIIQPYEFGDPVKKSTCLWLKGLPKLEPTMDVSDYVQYYVDSRGRKQSDWNAKQLIIDGKKYGYHTAEFKKHRSKTFEGVAQAMATQWAYHVINTRQQIL